MKIHLDQCTCNGIHILLTEEATYEIHSNSKISINSTSGLTYGTGYSEQCGTCLQFCSNFFGEEQEKKDSNSHHC